MAASWSGPVRRVVLVDAGLRPEGQLLPDGMLLVGGQLLTGLRGLGVSSDDGTDVVCTHLHVDHVGWLFRPGGDPQFPGATVWFGAADAAHSVDGPGEMAAHVREVFRSWAGRRCCARSLRTPPWRGAWRPC